MSVKFNNNKSATINDEKNESERFVTVQEVGNLAKRVKNSAVRTVEGIKDGSSQISVEDILYQSMKLPLVKIDRPKFLRKELIKYYPEEVIALAVENNPAYAGIERERIDEIARQVINYETNKVTGISFAAGLPGGFAMAATIPADITQYFGFILRIM